MAGNITTTEHTGTLNRIHNDLSYKVKVSNSYGNGHDSSYHEQNIEEVKYYWKGEDVTELIDELPGEIFLDLEKEIELD